MNLATDSVTQTTDTLPRENTSQAHAAQKSAPIVDTGYSFRWAEVPLYVLYVLAFAIQSFATAGHSDNGSPLFDEKHYSSQAMQMLYNSGVEDNPGYGLVVHPPMGKWLISIGEFFFGYTPLGWRFSSIIAGTIIVGLVMFISHRLSGSIMSVVLAGVIANTEGVISGMSRLGMLDIFLALFATLVALCITMDITTDNTDRPWHQRWWLLGAGVFSGLAMSVKVSGVYYPAFLGIVVVVATALTSRDVRQTARSFGMGLVFFFMVPTVVFLTTWLPWFADESTPYRRAAESAGGAEHPVADWLAPILPDSIESFYSYQRGVFDFHIGLTTSSGQLHPWESKPWHWLIGSRPMLLYTGDTDYSSGVATRADMWLIGNPAVWFLVVPVMIYGLYRLFRKDWKWAVPVGFFLAGWLPWAIGYDRQMYFFYAVAIAPFIVIAVTFAVIDCAQCVMRLTSSRKYTSSSDYRYSIPFLITVMVFIVIVITVFVFYAPWVYGDPITMEQHDHRQLFDFWEALEK